MATLLFKVLHKAILLVGAVLRVPMRTSPQASAQSSEVLVAGKHMGKEHQGAMEGLQYLEVVQEVLLVIPPVL